MMTPEPSTACALGLYHDFAHTGPDTPAGRYLRRYWQPILVGSELAPGRARRIQVMGENFTLYRGAGGAPFLLGDRCAHRGTTLAVGWVEGDEIRCRYHGWRYDGSGACVERPGDDLSLACGIAVPSHPAREYLGLIFAYLGAGEPPEFPRYPEWEADGVLEVGSYVRPCNFFNALEDAVDPAHATFTHQPAARRQPIPEVTARESAAGIIVTAQRPGQAPYDVLFGLPNIRRGPNPTGDPDAPVQETINWRVPIDDERHVNYFVCLAPIAGEARDRYLRRRAAGEALTFGRMVGVGDPSVAELADRVLAGELHLDELADHPAIISLQDTVVEMGQGVVSSHANDVLTRYDVGVKLLREIWAREIAATMAGRPLTPWHD